MLWRMPRHILSEHRRKIYVAGRSKGKQSSSATKEPEIQTMTRDAEEDNAADRNICKEKAEREETGKA